jgi:phospholipase C
MAKSRKSQRTTPRSPLRRHSSVTPPIDCIVVLMLENRSLDHLFGKWPGVAGIGSGTFANRANPAAPVSAANPAIAAGQPALFTVTQGQGPGHSLAATNVQLFGSSTVAANAALKAVNDRGFVANYRSELAVDGFGGADVNLSAVMQTFVAGQLPALSALAQNFVLCDQWYSEVPGPTMPNRLYMHAATSAGWAWDDWSVQLNSVTFYEQLQQSARSWAVYYSDQNEVAQYSRINSERANFKLYESAFAADAAAGRLANYNFIIPRFAGSVTDGPVTSMHAPQDVRPADALVAQIYAALRSSPQWGQSLYVVNFDEHGGYFDHANPGPAVNPDGINSPAPGDTASFAPRFSFNRMGLRAPALLASPYLPRGVVCSLPLQHTSVLVTARKLLGMSGSLTRRDAAAVDFGSLFLATARTDVPATLTTSAAALPAPIDAATAAPDDVMSRMARDWRRATGALPCALKNVSAPTSQDAVHRFLRNQIEAFLDYRARSARKAARPSTSVRGRRPPKTRRRH